MKKLKLEMLKVESFDTTAVANIHRGTVAAHEITPTLRTVRTATGAPA